MKIRPPSVWLSRLDAADLTLCLTLNRGGNVRGPVRHLLQISSRLGDGVVWYALLLLLPLVYGAPALRPALVMCLTGLVGHLVYKGLKRSFGRERPFVRHESIRLLGAPLDRHSFPSGHTLHAVAFSWQTVSHFPELGWVLVPLAGLIAASRVVLGLHYPSDVLAGGALGLALAGLGQTLG
jgi:undecaprenyl-diphosphatase